VIFLSGYDDIKQLIRIERENRQRVFVAGGLIGARALVSVGATGSVADVDSNSRDVVGANADAVVRGIGTGVNVTLHGQVPLVADARIEPGKSIKSGYGGKAGRYVDAALVGSSIIAVDGGGIGTWTPKAAGIGVTSRIHIKSANNADKGIRILVIAESATAGSFEDCVVALNGTTSVPVSNAHMENDQISNILGLSFLDDVVAAGIVTIGNTGSKKAVVTVPAGQSTAGWEIPADGRAYSDEVSVVYAGTNNDAHIGIYGYNEVGALVGEIFDFRDAGAAFGSARKYREIVAICVGSMLATDSVAVKVTSTEDDELMNVGKSLEEASGYGVEFDALLK